MAIFKFKTEDGKIAKIRADKQPSPEEAMEVIKAATSGASTGRFSSLPDQKDELAPLTSFQYLVTGFAPNDEVRIQFLKDEFSGSNVSKDTDGNITVDGKPVKSEEFKFTEDIIGNVGPALTFTGQVAGGTVGARGGVLGAVVGGVAGAGVGESARMALGKKLGLKTSLGEATSSVGKEAAFSLAGEGIVRGAGLALKPVGASIANFWKNASSQSGSLFPKLARYVGGIDENAVKTAQRHGFENTFTPTYFSGTETQSVVKNTLFGARSANAESLSLGIKELDGTQAGTKLLVNSIKEVDNELYNSLVRSYSNVSDNALRVIKRESSDEIFNPVHYQKNRAFVLAADITKKSESHLRTLGKNIEAIENRAIREGRGKPFQVDDIGKRLDKFLSESGLRGGIQVPGASPQRPPRISGLNKINELREALGTRKDGKFMFFGETKGDATLQGINVSQAIKVRRRLDSVVDDIMSNNRIPGKLKVAAFELADEFRGRLHTAIGMTDESANYSTFKNFIDQLRIDKDKSMMSLESQIRGIATGPSTTRTNVKILVSMLPDKQSQAISREIDLLNLADELKQVDVKKAMTAFESELNSDTFLSSSNDSFKETILRGIDNALRGGNKISRSRVFVDDAEKSLAAKKFMQGSTNILRLQAVIGMLGFGSVGTMIGGPGLGVAGAAIGLKATSPETLSKLLIKLQRLKTPQSLKTTSRAVESVAPAFGAGFLKSQANQQQAPEEEEF